MRILITFLLLSFSAHGQINTPAITSRGLDHVGITVPDLKVAKDFFEDNFGCVYVSTIGPWTLPSSMSNDRKTSVSPRAKSLTINMLECGEGSKIELFSYENSKGKSSWSDHEDVGAQHIAFYVDDVKKATEYLRSKGITIIGEPMEMKSGQTAGESWVHFMSPWGLEMELVESHKGKDYEKNYMNTEAVIQNHFKAINELDTNKRNELFELTYTPTIVFNDPHFMVFGQEKIKEAYDGLHKKFPAHTFKPVNIIIQNNVAQVKWQLLNKKKAVVGTGEDILIFEAGKIQAVHVFLNDSK